MKTRHIIILSCFLIVFGSCSKDFMETDSEYLTEKRKNQLLEQSPKDKAAIIAGEIEAVYSILRTMDLNGNTAHDYFGLKSMHLATDLNCEDIVQEKHHWFGFDYNLENRFASYRRTRLMWALFYKMVSSSNDFLEKYFKETPTEELVHLKAEVLALRGIAYFHLVNYYQLTYKGNEDKPGVPLILSSSDTKKPRAKVSEVYNQIIEDLTFAVDKGKHTPTNKKDADKKVAAAYLAKAYAAMEDWANVEKYAKIAIEGENFSVPTNFYKADNADVLWGAFINSETSTIYASFFSHMDNTINGYTGALEVYKTIHNKLYDKILDADARKKWFLKKGPSTPEMYKNLPDYSGLKFNSLADFTGDYIYIRTADPYLLLVEALANQSKPEAATVLKEFLSSRGISDEVDNHTSDLLEFVKLQRRIELWGEGTSLFDVKRWDLPINRGVDGTNHRKKINIPNPKSSYDLVYQIPKREIEQNPDLVQNP